VPAQKTTVQLDRKSGPDLSDQVRRIGGSSERLRLQKPLILRLWEDRTRRSLPSAERQLARPLLLNAIPKFLDRMIAILAGTLEVDSPEHERVAQEHGEQRAEQAGYSLEEVVTEYAILRDTLLEILEAESLLIRAERDLVLRIFDSAIRESATEFVRIHFQVLADERSKLESLHREAESREKFVSALAHDLRNPLTAARVSAELISQHARQTELSGTLSSKVIANLNRMDKMLRDLLDVSRLASGAPILLKWEPCELVAIVQELFRDLSTIYGNRFVLNARDSFRGYWGAEGLRRAIENLLSNAVKYGTQGTPVTVTLKRIDEMIRISVHNEGNPISSEEQGQLFRPFIRTRSAMESGKKGWGLGLILAKSVAEAHYGRIEVESSLETGTTFRLFIRQYCETPPVRAKQTS
jgi:signal transduction histidine kinase